MQLSEEDKWRGSPMAWKQGSVCAEDGKQQVFKRAK